MPQAKLIGDDILEKTRSAVIEFCCARKTRQAGRAAAIKYDRLNAVPPCQVFLTKNLRKNLLKDRKCCEHEFRLCGTRRARVSAFLSEQGKMPAFSCLYFPSGKHRQAAYSLSFKCSN